MNGYNPYNQYPYSGYGYQPFNSRQFVQPQQQVQPQSQQPMQFEMPIQDVRFVTSEEAKAFIVMPNRNALLIDKLNGMAHFKFADSLGQSATQCFKFEQVNIDGTPVKEQETPPKIDYSQFATVEQYNDLLSKFNSLSEAVSNMKQQKGENKPVARDFGVDKGNTHQVRQQA